ncbi:hypothetical protein QBC39DRAFT_415772 [Podospora conica]|nr:hypothetical protein QBC39DRAFT_415772 [Schizothecium conicum]
MAALIWGAPMIVSSWITQGTSASPSDTMTATPTPSAPPAPPRLPDLPTLTKQLGEAASAACPATPTPYNKVKVFLMSWEKDDLDTDTELACLASIFQGLYHFDTESWKIPLRRSAGELSRKIASVIDADGKDGNLIIFYYTGHSRPNEHPDGRPVWFATRTPNTPFVKSSVFHSHLGTTDSDILLLYDCPHSVQSSATSSKKRVIETLAALPLDPKQPQTAADDKARVFTASIIQELTHAAHTKQPLSIVDLHARLISRQQSLSPREALTSTAEYSILQLDANTKQPIPARHRHPIHNWLSSKPRTIVLAPLAAPETTTEADCPAVLITAPTTPHTSKPAFQGPEVLIACRIQEETLDTDKWTQWLAGAPEGAQEVCITAVHPSLDDSILLLLRMPVQIWDMLPTSQSVSLVGYTMGDGPSTTTGGITGAKKSRGDASVRRTWPKNFSQAISKVDDATKQDTPEPESGGDRFAARLNALIEDINNDNNDPARRYIAEEMESFCLPASIEDEDVGSELVAVLTERGEGLEETTRFLDRKQLVSELLEKTETSGLEKRERQRLIYITNVDSYGRMAIAAAAPKGTASFVKDFLYKHVAFRSGIEAKMTSMQQAFQLSFHLPVLAWRKDRAVSLDPRNLRDCRAIGTIGYGAATETYLYEAQVSCMVSGTSNGSWTTHALFDTYHDDGSSKHDVQVLKADEGRLVDVLIGQHDSPTPITDARDYFLRSMESCVQVSCDEWRNSGASLLKAIKNHIKDMANPADANPHTTRRLVHLSQEFQHGLTSTTRAWERFKDTDMTYFSPLSASQQSSIINIDNDMHDLEVFRESLSQQGIILQTLSSSLSALDNKNAAKLNNIMMATATMFLPFILMALITASPSLSGNITSQWYILASLSLAALAGISVLAIANGEASLKMIEDASQLVRNTKVPDLKNMTAGLGIDKLSTISFQVPVQRLRSFATVPTLPELPSMPQARSFPGVSRLHVLPRVDTDGLARVVRDAKKQVGGLWRGWWKADQESSPWMMDEGIVDEDVMDERLAPILEAIEEVDEREVLIRMIEEEETEDGNEQKCVVTVVTGI